MTQVVTADATTTVVISTVNPTVFGQSVTFTATVTANAPGSGIPTGKVAFDNGAAAIAGCGGVTLVAGVATCTTTALTVGVHSITGVYNGSSSYLTSTSTVVTETVNQGSTTVVAGSSLDPSVSGQAVTYTATVTVVAPAAGTPTGTVDFQDGGVTIAGCGAKTLAAAGTATCAVTYAGAGTHSITAIYSGNASFAASTSPTFTQTVNQASTSTALASSLNPSVTGEPVTLTASVSVIAPGSGTRTGTVMFEDGGVTIAGCAANAVSAAGIAVCAAAFATTGAHPLTALYSGDANFSGSTSPTLTETVNQGGTATLVTSSANPSVSGQVVLYTSTIAALAPASGTPSGTATFMDGIITIGGCIAQPLIGGVATCSIAYPGVGSHAITAVYSGDLNFTASKSPSLTQTVIPASTSTLLGSSVDPSVSGQPVTFTATVSVLVPGSGVPTGTVAFLDDGTTIGGCATQPVTGAGLATCSDTFASAGAETITAVYSGDAIFNGSTSAALTQTINQGATTTAVTPSVDPSVSGQSVSYTASVFAVTPASGTPTGTAAFLDGGATITGCGAQPLTGGVASCPVVYAGAGTHEITAVYSGDPNFTGSTSPAFTQTVNPAATSTSLSSFVNPSVTGQSVTMTATVSVNSPGSGTPTGTVSFEDNGTVIAGCTAEPVISAGIATCADSFVAGAEAITAVYSGDANFISSTSPILTQTIIQGATAAVVAASVNPSVAGQGISYTATVSAVAPASGTPTGAVAFLDGASTIPGCATQALVAGLASCSVTYAVAGSHAITAVYSGDPNFIASTSAPLNQQVMLGASTTTLTSPADVWAAGQPGIFDATVAPVGAARVTPTGTTAFMDAGAPIPGCAAQPVVSGKASCSVAFTDTGAHPITAVYSGDAALAASTSPTLLLSVYDDPPTPDAGESTSSTSWGYIAILGGVFLVFLVGCARLRRRDADGAEFARPLSTTATQVHRLRERHANEAASLDLVSDE